MYTLINGSPKVSDPNSLYFLNYVGNNLNNFNVFSLKKDNYKEILNSIKLSDVILLAFPLYVDSPTSLVLSFLDFIYDNKVNIKEKRLYTIINCGFREGEQNITAVNIIKRWCDKVGAKYSGSLLIGAGEIVGKEKYKPICRKALKKLDNFSKVIKGKDSTDDIITTMDFLGNRIYCFLANINWNKSGKRNKLKPKDIRST